MAAVVAEDSCAIVSSLPLRQDLTARFRVLGAFLARPSSAPDQFDKSLTGEENMM